MTIEEIKDTLQTWIKNADDEFDREEMGRVYGLKSALHLIKNLDVLNTNAGDLISRRAVIEWLKDKDINYLFSGDLLNQITTSSYISRDYNIPFIGTFSACSSFTLTLGLAASYVNFGYANNAIAFTSSHNATAERQFRYPLEYGVQKK